MPWPLAQSAQRKKGLSCWIPVGWAWLGTALTSVSLAVFLVSPLQVSMCPAARKTTSGAGQGSGQDTDPSSAFHLATASPQSRTTHRVHKRDAKDVVAEEEQLLLHQTPLVVYLDFLWQGAEGHGEVQQEGSERP